METIKPILLFCLDLLSFLGIAAYAFFTLAIFAGFMSTPVTSKGQMRMLFKTYVFIHIFIAPVVVSSFWQKELMPKADGYYGKITKINRVEKHGREIFVHASVDMGYGEKFHVVLEGSHKVGTLVLVAKNAAGNYADSVPGYKIVSVPLGLI